MLLDQGHEVLDFGGGDVGEGESLDVAGAAGVGMGDGAAVLQRAGEGSSGADFEGLVFEGEGGDALQEVSGSDEGGVGRVAVVLADLPGGRGERRPGAFGAGLGLDVRLEVGLERGGQGFEEGAGGLLQAGGGGFEELPGPRRRLRW